MNATSLLIPKNPVPARRTAPVVQRRRYHWTPGARLAWLLLAAPLSALAGEPLAEPPAPADLTLANFLTEGWNEPWARRARGERTPDMSLLRVQTNFLAQLFRTDFSLQRNPGTAGVRESDLLSGTLEYALNRRFMLAVIGNYRWLDFRAHEDMEGSFIAGFARFQLLDAAKSSLATTFRVGAPNRDLGEKNTILSLALAGWQDLAAMGLPRVGLYYHVQEETLAGPATPHTRRNVLTYDISLAKTWTQADAFFGNATTFIEAYGKTDLDGDRHGLTLITLTPGVRATFAHRHIVMAGVEFPVTEPRPFDRIARLTYIVNF
jgi:hypothetical protein